MENAIREFSCQLEKKHQGVVISKSGIRLHNRFPVLGASADAIGKCVCHGEFLIEVKCPHSHRDKKIEECIADKDFCRNENLLLKTKHKYMTQVQMQMAVYEVGTCFLDVWAPQFCYATKVAYNKTFENYIDSLVKFHKSHVAKELITRKIEKEKEMEKSKEKTRSMKLYCMCQKPYTGEENMIGSDNPSCKYEWFNFSCISIRRPPKGKWLCNYCK